jgi:hypothetical protein
VTAQIADLITEEEHTAWWGGSYSTFKTISGAVNSNVSVARKRILELGMEANPISLELAATAAYLADEGDSAPWIETAKRKPEKAAKCLDEAIALYAKLKSVKTPKPLPAI